MAFSTAQFTAAQSIGNLEDVVLTDTSVGSDVGLTSRTVTFSLADGSTLVEDGTTTTYEIWPIASPSITLSLLDKSYATQITVRWYTNLVVTYTATLIYVFNLRDYVFAYGLTQIQTSSPQIINDNNFYGNKIKLIVNANDAENAVRYANDLYGSQSALDRNALLMSNQNVFF